MYKLKIKKPGLIKIKIFTSFPDIILANLQEKEVTPTKQEQIIVSDNTYDGLSKVTVNPYEANVKSKTITKNGIYKASDEDLDGYSEVDVDVNLDLKITDCRYLFYSHARLDIFNELCNLISADCIDMSYMFYNCYNLTSIPKLDTSKVTIMDYMFSHCTKLVSIPELDTSKVTNMNYMFYNCKKLVSVPELDASKVTGMYGMFANCSSLENFGGFKNLGEAYKVPGTANYYKADLSSCPNLSHDSLMNVINNLYDIKTKGCNPQQLVLGSTNLEKLTEEEIAMATNKGWNVS